MSESKPNSVGLFAYPISDPPLRFHHFLYDYGHEIGRAGRDVILWRPIGDPAQHDEAYRRLRTSALEERDQEDSKRFKEEIRQLGSEEWVCRREYREYAQTLRVSNNAPPLVVFTAPPLKNKAILKFEPVVLDKPEWRRELASVFTNKLTADAFSRLRQERLFTDATMMAVQRYLWEVGLAIFRVCAPGARKLPDHLKVGVIPRVSSGPVDTDQDTKMRWWLRQDCSLAVTTTTGGLRDGTIEFDLYNGRATNQQNLMLILIHAWPNYIVLEKVLRALYLEEATTVVGSPEKARGLLKRLHSTLLEIRKKFQLQGLPAEILPTINIDNGSRRQIRLHVAHLWNAEKSDSVIGPGLCRSQLL